MKKVNFEDIKHLIPENAPYNHEDFRSPILYADGNQTWTEPVDLDETEDFYPFVLINGNLTATQIFNEETDGSTGLIVLGNLSAENIVVGGQCIYVTGDITVNGLYWGDYNHGELIVEGHIRVRAFINTDYGVDFARFNSKDRTQIDHLLWDEAGDYDDIERLRICIKPEFILHETDLDIDDMYSWKEWINYDTLFDALRRNTPVLLPPAEIQPITPGYPLLFTNENISEENLNALSDSIFFPSQAPKDGSSHIFEYWQEDIFKRILYIEGTPLSSTAYFQYDEQYACMVYYGYESTLLNKLSGKKEYKLAISYRPTLNGEQKWVKLDKQAPQKYHDFLNVQWKNLLHELSEMHYLREQYATIVTVKRFDEIMSLPLVQQMGEKYYKESEDSYLLFRGVEWQFRNASAGKEKARITIAKYNGYDDEGEPVYTFYHFQKEMEKDNGQEKIVLFTQDENDFSSGVYKVSVSERDTIKSALHQFQLLDKHIDKKNENFRKK